MTLAAVSIAAWCAPGVARAQSPCAERCPAILAPARSWLEATSGAALEEYLRALQLDTSRSRRYPQTVRGFGTREVPRMLVAAAPAGEAPRAPGARLELLRPGVRSFVNTGFPFGINDGPVWAGRGLTLALDAGAFATAGPLSLRVQPVLLWAQNAAFPLADDARPGAERYRNAADPLNIDLPQRPGGAHLRRLDLGDSELRVDVGGLAAGVSNARQTWGPGTTHPLVLGPNAPGFLHAFVGTARPLPIWIGTLHGRLIVGRLDQSDWSPAADTLDRRVGSGVVLTLTPRGVPSLEIGGTRFFHRAWMPGETPWGAWAVPFTGLLFKRNALFLDDVESGRAIGDNQIASVFARLALRDAGAELYGEYARNDAALDVRELITEPDHQSAYLLGARARIAARGGALRLVRVEWVNARTTHLYRVRPSGPFYSHTFLRQGHTHRGELLGSVAVQGGGGAVIGVDAYGARGRTTLELHRIGRGVPPGEGAPSPRAVDVQYAARYERTRLLRRLDLTTGATAVWELNRDYRRDAFNVHLVVGARFGGERPAPGH